LDENGDPAIGVLVSAFQPYFANDGTRVIDLCSGAKREGKHASVRTDDKGEYRLFDLAAGKFYLTVEPKLPSSTTSPCAGGVPQFYPGAVDPADAVLVDALSGESISMNLRLAPQQLHVVRFGIREGPKVVDTGVSLFHINRETRDGLVYPVADMRWSSTSPRGFLRDADGRYVSPGLPRGSYDIYFVPDSASNRAMGHFHVNIADRDVDAGTLTITEGARVSGKVTSAAGTRVGVEMVAPTLGGSVLDMRYATLTDAATQAFQFSVRSSAFGLIGAVPDGHYRVRLAPNSPANLYLESARYASANVLDSGFSVAGVSSGPLELTLATGSVVTGTVRNLKDEPVADSHVALIPSANHRQNLGLYKSDMTDQYGRFSFAGVAPGDYQVFAWEEIEPNAWLNAEYIKEFEARSARITVSVGGAEVTVHVIPATN
jgi:hypothetical protein